MSSTRYTFAIFGFLGLAMLFAMLVDLSIAIVAMVNSTFISSHTDVPEIITCPYLHTKSRNDTSEKISQKDGEFYWDPRMQSFLLGASFYGRTVTAIPAGIATKRWSAKWLFGSAVFVMSICTLLSPIVSRWNVYAFVAIRAVQGLADGFILPCANAMIGRWSPKVERSRMTAFVFSGTYVGNVLTLAVSGYLSETNFLGGWPSIFYVIGICGCVWFIFWSFLIYDGPENHPRISREELLYITKESNLENIQKTSKIPWKSIMSSACVWALIVTHFGQLWGTFTLMTAMPTYLATVLHFNITENGLLSSMPFILQAVASLIASYVADKMVQSGKLKITIIRKIFNSIGLIAPGICLIIVGFVGCRPIISVALLCAALGFNGIATAGYRVTYIEISPQYAGVLIAITGFIGATSGFLGPYAVGQIRTRGDTIQNWRIIFGISAGIYFTSAIIYDLFCSAELQPWNTVPSDTTMKNTSQYELRKSSKSCDDDAKS